MKPSLRWLLASFAGMMLALPSWGSNLVTAEWLAKNLGRDDIVLIDTSGTRAYGAGHIPGAVNADLYGSGVHRLPAAQIERQLQAWGISAGKKVVMYDPGASMMATWLFYELYYHGFAPADLLILDGGLSRWKATGGAVTKEAGAPKAGDFRITALREAARTRLPEFLAASGDTKHHALVEALEPGYHFGQDKFFDRAGHVPNALLMPVADFYNADKTFKSPAEISRMAAWLGIKPEQEVHSHCGGGVAASVPFFALRFLAGYPKVKLYKESQREWLRDDRGLPFWTYAAPYLKRDATWLSGWNQKMMRMYGVSAVSVIDVRAPDAFKQGHVPFALNVPAGVFRSHLDNPSGLAKALGPAGVEAAHEAVIVSNGGLDPGAALAFVALEQLGQSRVSILMESVDDWGLLGHQVTKDVEAAPPKAYAPAPRQGVVTHDARAVGGPYPRVYIASGAKVPATPRDGKVVHVPYVELLNANRTPKAAAEIWKVLEKAGVPRYAELFVYADDPGEAAVNYFVLRLMGFPDVKMLVS